MKLFAQLVQYGVGHWSHQEGEEEAECLATDDDYCHGATFFSADHQESETKFSFGLGAGVKYFRWNAVGLRAHVRYRPTMLNDKDAADFCDPFGFCQGTLQQIEFMGGAVVRF